tara:strand:- start:364 stop:519 length:156 start_codon:yes stop_codon:yes gene_type:complete
MEERMHSSGMSNVTDMLKKLGYEKVIRFVTQEAPQTTNFYERYEMRRGQKR